VNSIFGRTVVSTSHKKQMSSNVLFKVSVSPYQRDVYVMFITKVGA